MPFHELLWSIHPKIIKRIIEENTCDYISEITASNDIPESSRRFINQFEQAIKQYKSLKDVIDASCCNSSTIPEANKSLYIQAFCNGISEVVLDFNQTLLLIEESFLSGLSMSTLEIFDKLGQYVDILASLNQAVGHVKENKYGGCKILDLCELLIVNNPHIQENVFRKIQKHCLKQFYKQTKLWITLALLDDPHLEYFITNVESSLSFDSSVCSVNSRGLAQCIDNCESSEFKVLPENLPSVIPLSIAMKILFIGEALRVCQHKELDSRTNERILSVCGVSEQKIAERLIKIESESFSLKNLSNLIDDLWIGVNKYIRQISDEIGNLKDQLNLMWELYLLGRGELFQEFLLKGSTVLNTDFTLVDSRNLNVAFKDAIYYVYLTEYSDLTDQFFFKLPNRKALGQGFTAWSVMQLKCKVKWPLHYLFTQDVVNIYNRLFIFLLRLKKAQIDVTSTWKSINSIRSHTLRMELIEVRMLLLAVVGNLQNYCFTNVIANEMTALLEAAKNATMFTDVQKALNLFLTNISNHLFIPNACFSSITSDTNYESVNKFFETIFDLCRVFSELNIKNDESILLKLKSFKTKLNNILEKLFSLLNKIYQAYYHDTESSSSHLHNLMLCLDYNRFFLNKFNLASYN